MIRNFIWWSSGVDATFISQPEVPDSERKTYASLGCLVWLNCLVAANAAFVAVNVHVPTESAVVRFSTLAIASVAAASAALVVLNMQRLLIGAAGRDAVGAVGFWKLAIKWCVLMVVSLAVSLAISTPLHTAMTSEDTKAMRIKRESLDAVRQFDRTERANLSRNLTPIQDAIQAGTAPSELLPALPDGSCASGRRECIQALAAYEKQADSVSDRIRQQLRHQLELGSLEVSKIGLIGQATLAWEFNPFYALCVWLFSLLLFFSPLAIRLLLNRGMVDLMIQIRNRELLARHGIEPRSRLVHAVDGRAVLLDRFREPEAVFRKKSQDVSKNLDYSMKALLSTAIEIRNEERCRGD